MEPGALSELRIIRGRSPRKPRQLAWLVRTPVRSEPRRKDCGSADGTLDHGAVEHPPRVRKRAGRG